MDIEEIFKEHINNIPEKKWIFFDRESGLRLNTKEFISWKLKYDKLQTLKHIAKEKRQEILDKFRQGSITIGEIAKKFKVSSEAVGDLIYYNISSVSLLNKESI